MVTVKNAYKSLFLFLFFIGVKPYFKKIGTLNYLELIKPTPPRQQAVTLKFANIQQ